MKGIVTVGKFPEDGNEYVNVYGDDGLMFTATKLPQAGHGVAHTLINGYEVLIYRNRQGKIKTKVQRYETGLRIPRKWMR